MSTPIADLTYRNYDGPLEAPRKRWWVIAKQLMKAAIKKRWLYVFLAFSAAYYLIMLVIIFFFEQAFANSQDMLTRPGMPPGATQINPFEQFMARIVWKDQFLHGLSFGQLSFMAILLMVGIGTIANDNRANALLVYLSKPCSKKDYLVGKWMGTFLLMLAVLAIPSLFFYLYGILNFRDYGFWKNDPWLLARVAAILPIQAAFLSSLSVGVSSLFNQGRLAGATFAGFYFLTNFFTQLMTIAWGVTGGARGTDLNGPENLIKTLYYMSIDGLNIGVTKAILNTDGTPWGGIPSRMISVPMPNLWLMLAIMGGLSAMFLAIAWRKVRAVEVVG